MDFPASSNSPSDGSSRTLWFFGLCASIVLFVLFLGIVNHCYNKHYGMPLPAPAVTNQNFHEFMPGIKRGDVEELLANVERWECSICAFQSLLQKPACSLCGTPRDTRLVEVSPEVVVPRMTRSSSVLRRSSIAGNYRHRSKSTLPRHSMRRLSVLFQKAILPDDLNARQRSARMRKQWSRQIDGAGHVSWKRHFIDSEDFPAAFFVQLNPSQDEMFANHEVEPLDECVVITLRGSIVRGLDKTQDADRLTEPESPVDESDAGAGVYSELKSAKAIAWLDLATGDPNKTVLGTSISEAMWSSLLPLTKLAFTLKYAWFLHQTADLFVPYDELYIKTKVHRSRLFEEALENLLHLDGRALCAILRFQFVGESGLDAGAIQREWYMLVAQAMLSETSGMFIEANRDDHSFFINPNCAADMTESAVHYLDAFRAAGRFIGRALLDGQVLPLHLSPVLFKALLGMPCTLDDIETLDKTLYKSLRYLLDNKHVDELALTFSVTQERAGKLVEVDLVPHGQDVPVTDANKHAYIERMMRHLLFDRIQDPLHALIQGTYDVVPPELLLVFDHKELELILCGQSDIDVDDWETSTVTSSNLKNSAVLEWFWQLVRALSSADQAKLLQYATGSSRVPVQGFQGLTSYDGKICYFTLKGVPYTLGAYPVAHACYNRIDLPLYPTQELLDDAVRTLLLSDPTGFNMQ